MLLLLRNHGAGAVGQSGTFAGSASVGLTKIVQRNVAVAGSGGSAIVKGAEKPFNVTASGASDASLVVQKVADSTGVGTGELAKVIDLRRDQDGVGGVAGTQTYVPEGGGATYPVDLTFSGAGSVSLQTTARIFSIPQPPSGAGKRNKLGKKLRRPSVSQAQQFTRSLTVQARASVDVLMQVNRDGTREINNAIVLRWIQEMR